MGVFSRSWDITKATLEVMKKDKEIFIFPVLTIVISLAFLVFLAAFAFIAGILSVIAGIQIAILGYFLLFIFYLFSTFINTFFSACVVYTASIRFNGKNATFRDSISFSSKRIGKIFLWSIVSAIVGLILKIIEGITKRTKGASKIVLGILRSIFGLVWSIATIFVVQGIVYKDLGPFASIKDSVITLKKTWGESLIKYIGFGAIEGIFLFAGLIIVIPIIFLTLNTNPLFAIISILVYVAYLIVIAVFFSVAEGVYNTALYIYANTGKVVDGYDKEQLRQAFKPEGSSI